jgi:integrase
MYVEKALLAFRALERLGFVPSPMGVTRVMVEALLHDEELAPTTRSTYALCLHGLLAFVGNPIAGPDHKRLWKPPRWVATRRRWATLDEMTALLNVARDDAARVGIALFECGLRRDEVVRLRVSDLEQTPSGWVARVRGKGGKPRAVPLTAQAIDALVPVVHQLHPESLVYRWKRSRLSNDVTQACMAAGVRHLSPHDLRRGYAREYLRVAVGQGMSYPDALGSLQGVLGHEEPAQTLYYAEPGRESAVRGVSLLSAAYALANKRGA